MSLKHSGHVVACCFAYNRFLSNFTNLCAFCLYGELIGLFIAILWSKPFYLECVELGGGREPTTGIEFNDGIVIIERQQICIY